MTTMVNSRRGRPAGASDARERIIRAAQDQFLSQGYSATTVRAIAEQAGVDHALVNYHFGSKDRLFGRAVGMLTTPRSQLQHVDFTQPPATLAPTILVNAMRLWGAAAFIDPLLELLYDSPRAATALLGDYVHEQIYLAIVDGLPGARAEQRAAAVSTVMVGLFFARCVARIEPVASMSEQDVIRVHAPLLVTALTGATLSRSRRP